jgi:hypothetical protein
MKTSGSFPTTRFQEILSTSDLRTISFYADYFLPLQIHPHLLVEINELTIGYVSFTAHIIIGWIHLPKPFSQVPKGTQLCKV